MGKTNNTVEVLGETLVVVPTRYAEGNRIAFILYDMAGEAYATLTVNLPHVELYANEIAVKTWGENAPLREPLLESDLFEDTGKRVPTGYVQAEIWRITHDIYNN